MSGLITLRDYFRNSVGAGINAATYSVKRLFDDAVITSGSTAADADPATSLDGFFSADETTLGYPGPLKYEVIDPVTAAIRVHTSKSIGVVGSWRSIDVTRSWRLFGTGVMPGVLSELAVSTNGTNLIISVASGSMVAVVAADHGMLYSWPAVRTVTASAAHATLGRIDTMVLRFYPPGVEQEGRVDLALLAGAPHASPSAPTLTQDATMWEVPLADIQIDATVTSLAVDKVTDRRTWSFLYPAPVVAGDMFYADASGKLARLPKGTSGQYLKQGATIPAWDTVSDADLTGVVSDSGDTMTGTLTINSDSNPALAVRKTDGTTQVLFVRGDPDAIVALSNAADLAIFSDNAFSVPTFSVNGTNGDTVVGALTATGNVALGSADSAILTMRGRRIRRGVRPAIAVQVAAGSGAAASIAGTDEAGIVIINMGTSDTTGDLAIITLTTARASGNWYVRLEPLDSDSVANQTKVRSRVVTTTTWAVNVPSTALSDVDEHQWGYEIVEWVEV